MQWFCDIVCKQDQAESQDFLRADETDNEVGEWISVLNAPN